MAKFSDIAKGSHARLRGISCTSLEGLEFTCDLCIMTGTQEELATAAAQKRAADMAGTKGENDINFQFAYAVEAVLASALDPESPDDKPERFFLSAEQIRDGLDRERILYLAEMQRAFQDRVSPRKKALSRDEYYVEVVKLLDDEKADEHPFWTWPRTTQESFLRSMAADLAWNSQERRSSPGTIESAASQKH